MEGEGRKRFCPIALTDWIEAASRAGIPYVGAARVAEVMRDDILRFDEPGAHQQRLTAGMAKAHESIEPGTMLRWDCCASSDVKHEMARRGTCSKAARESLRIDDPRFYEIAGEWPRETLPILRRPWIRIESEGGWPREYRAFVTDGEVVGISSYYPQRPLGRRDAELDGIREMTGALNGALDASFQWARGAEGIAEMIRWETNDRGPQPSFDGVHFTADFAATAGGVVLLEGGRRTSSADTRAASPPATPRG